MSEPTKVIVVGAGITGICAAYYLQANRIPYVLLEANADVGGVWHTQRWPGCRCDSDIVKYSYSFKPMVSGKCLLERAEMQAYLRSVVDDCGIVDNIRFGTTVTGANYRSGRGWEVTTNTGTFHSRFLVNGNGYFSSTPFTPEFAGAADFGGPILHASNTDEHTEFAGKDVVLVGSGSTAMCCAPALAKLAKSVVLLQRSPTWIYEMEANTNGWLVDACQALYKQGVEWPLFVMRYLLQMKDDVVFTSFRRFPWFARWYFRQRWRPAVGADVYDRHFQPSYKPFYQRIPLTIGLADAVRSKQVGIVTGDIDYFAKGRIVLKSGEALTCDAVVLATGFKLQFVKFPLTVDGEPVNLHGINFYKGIMMGGVPNYFHPVGVWHSAWTQRSESATKYAVRVMRHMARTGKNEVMVPRRAVPYRPSILPNYITREGERLPFLYGSTEMPTLDNLIAYRFRPRSFVFRDAQPSERGPIAEPSGHQAARG